MDKFVKLFRDIMKIKMSNINFKVVLIIVAVGILATFTIFDNKNTHLSPYENSKGTGVVTANFVEVKSYDYAPQKIKVKKGTTVTWENFDLVPHTVTKSENSKIGPDSKLFGKGEKFSYTFSEKGTYEYFCKPHPYMKGIVEVTE